MNFAVRRISSVTSSANNEIACFSRSSWCRVQFAQKKDVRFNVADFAMRLPPLDDNSFTRNEPNDMRTDEESIFARQPEQHSWCIL